MRPTELFLDSALRNSFAGAAAFTYASLCAAIVMREQRKRKDKSALTLAQDGSPNWLVAYASQTGEGEAIALATGRRLHQAGLSVRVMELNEVSAELLRQAERALFVVSTYGEGDAPDNGALFAAQAMSGGADLSHLHFAVLALGDDSYAWHCGFGRALDAWLISAGAQAMQARIEVNRGDAEALSAWQALLTHLAGSSDAPDWTAPPFETWRLARRRCLNPGSRGAPLYEIELLPQHEILPDWESGDLAQLCVTSDTSKPREYSIASLPSEGSVRLLVRLHRDAQGRTGLSSGWLAQAEVGSSLLLRVRPHRLFRLNGNAERPLLLIGNGSGLAGLRGHIKAQAEAGVHRSWLIYGERNRNSDSIWTEELEAWRDVGVLQRLDRVFSRDNGDAQYVQDVLLAAPDTVRQWIAKGAAIYVCGSRTGMAEGVEHALRLILGEKVLADLKRAGRYRRDVY